ncbi:hypothetical protein [Aquirhabdus parva]|uniref:Uncharacterized protein n=1 Tax=Aquirhabdus parva TaxID=2283318 RepID=A0A345P998_9GAMM|nr:hypothetical protein [Aquirhabdus parva]AXI03857.1 hypothetical protein HYN46_14035 [Aquirhabdus parva]
MLPNQTLSTTPIIGEFSSPDSTPFRYTTDTELGGIALNNSSQGLEVQTWTATITRTGIAVSAPNTPAIELITGQRITEVALAFDQNMRPHIAYVQNDVPKLYWYNTAIGAQVTSVYLGITNPRLCLDDKRPSQSSASDVLMFYLKDRSLFFRAQRDRFGVEYPLGPVEGNVLRRVAMNNKLRIQIEIERKPADEL